MLKYRVYGNTQTVVETRWLVTLGVLRVPILSLFNYDSNPHYLLILCLFVIKFVINLYTASVCTVVSQPFLLSFSDR